MMSRKANWFYDVKRDTFVVNLVENDQVVQTKEYQTKELAEASKQVWLSGGGPEFLQG